MGMESRIQLHVQATPAKIEMSTQPGRLALTNTPPRLALSTQAATFEGASSTGALSIDQYPSRYSYNIKTIPDLLAEAVQSGYQTALATIGRIAADGDSVAAGATVADMAVQAAQPIPSEIDLISITRPQISYNMQRNQGYYQPGQVRNDTQPGRVDNNTQHVQVDVRVSQKPEVRFWTTGQIDRRA